MTKAKKQKQPSPEVRKLKDASKQAFEAGDYCRVREISLQIQGLEPDSAESQAAAESYSQLGVDPVVVQFGAAVIFLYFSGWALAFF
jgi:hypothetical protein